MSKHLYLGTSENEVDWQLADDEDLESLRTKISEAESEDKPVTVNINANGTGSLRPIEITPATCDRWSLKEVDDKN